MNKEVMTLKQEPIVEYSLIEAKGKEVAEHIASLNIESIEATEDNLQVIKRTRSTLSNDLKDLEAKRVMIKKLILDPYEKFNDMYTKHIKNIYYDADKLLKEKAGVVEGGLLDAKKQALEEYFAEQNTFEFVQYEAMAQKVTRSMSDKKLKEEIDEFILSVHKDIDTIKTLPNNERIMAKYEITKDMNRSIREVSEEVEREEANKKRAEEAKQREEEAKRRAEEATANPQEVVTPQSSPAPIVEEDTPQNNAEQIVKTSFTVTATRAQIQELKTYMNEKGINYGRN